MAQPSEPDAAPPLPNPSNLSFVEALYADFARDPEAVEPRWREYFSQFGNGRNEDAAVRPQFPRFSIFNPPGGPNGQTAASDDRRAGAPPGRHQVANLQDRLDQLVRAYRVRGHTAAQLDPLGIPRPEHTELNPGFYGFTEAHMDQPFSARSIFGEGVRPLREIVRTLRNTYCRRIGVQFMHIDDPAPRLWLQRRMESTENRLHLTRDEQLRILTRLTDAVIFEEFIQKKYIGAKSFSLEGSESLVPLLDLAIEKAGEQGIVEIVLAMAHRGRLNVLANIMGKSPKQIFREFEDRDPDLHRGRGDVKYHLGHSTDWTTVAGKKIHLSLCFNPSHLEFVDAVAVGRVRAKQDCAGDVNRERGMALVIHGDAAFIGEGIVQETLNLSQVDGYYTGGTLHVIVNNQVGFTTSPEEGRSTVYASDLAKMLQSPIFHVNGEDPEAVAQVVRLAMDFRDAFRRDVVIDMYGYRRHGHNEGDEPSFTQPVMYRAIRARKSVREGYLEHLLKLAEVTREEADRIAHERRQRLEEELSVARRADYRPTGPPLENPWHGFHGGPEDIKDDPETGVSRGRLSELLDAQTRFPDGFHPHPKIARAVETRREMAAGKRPLDWAAAESLAFATLAVEGHRIRLAGQDSARGTFSQRHAVLYDYEDGRPYVPLRHLAAGQAPVDIINSPLSEAGVLGFEYGFSMDCPGSLVMWEAQFGDFVNAAQVIVDQFIASGESKWHRLSGLVLLLPHGFEGQGPEHSSARLERFLALAAEDNLQIAYPTTPAQYFHLLRRQVIRRWRKPLVVMTPKSLLRHPRATSTLDELAAGRFERILPDAPGTEGTEARIHAAGRMSPEAAKPHGREDAGGRNGGPRAAKPNPGTKPHRSPPNQIAPDPSARRQRALAASRVLLCSGKIYYELLEQREKAGRQDIPILRLEQLYPLHDSLLAEALSAYSDSTPVVWVQEEPRNMGAWPCLRLRFGDRVLGKPFSGIFRPAAASPATGSTSAHKIEQAEILGSAFVP